MLGVLFIPCPPAALLSALLFILELVRVPWKKTEPPKPSRGKFLSVDTKFHIQRWFHFHHMPFPKQTARFPVNGEVWGCGALELCESRCCPRSDAVSSLLSFLFASWGFIFCQRFILFEWLSNACAGGRSERAAGPGVIAGSSGIRDG